MMFPPLHEKLLENAVAVGYGPWRLVADYGPMAVEVDGITTATVKIWGSIEETPTEAGSIQVGADVTADAIRQITDHYRWIRAEVDAWTAGTINSWISGQYHG